MGWGRRKLSGFAGGGNSVYNTAGATLSEKNAIKEFRITSAQLDKGVEENKLSVQWRSCHGNSHRLFTRSEVSEYAKSCPKDAVLEAKATKAELKANAVRLAEAEAMVHNLTAKKRELEDAVVVNDENAKKAKTTSD